MWKWIYDGNYGVLNLLLLKLGAIDKYQWWFKDSILLALFMCAIVHIWRSAPFSGVLFFAGLTNISRDLYECASLDGANSWQQFLHISIPGIRPVLMVVLMLQTTWGLKSFDVIYSLTKGGPGTNTMTAYMYVYKQAFEYANISYGSALGYLFAAFSLIVVGLYYKVLNRDT
jgi:multiple sugar transport system permease protein